MKWTLQFSCSNKLRRVIFIANSCSFKPGWQKSNKGRDYLKIKSCKALHSKVLYINFHLSSVYILCSKVFLLGWSITNLMSFRQVTACCDPPESKEKGIKDWITAYFTLTWRYPWLWLLSWTLRAIVPHSPNVGSLCTAAVLLLSQSHQTAAQSAGINQQFAFSLNISQAALTALWD